MASVKELKSILAARGIDSRSVLEKSELVALVEQSAVTAEPIKMSVAELRELVKKFAGRSRTCCEKRDLFLLAKSLLANRKCPICLSELLSSFDEVLVVFPCCHEVVHQPCIAEWVLKSDKPKLSCLKCTSLVDPQFIKSKILSPLEWERYMVIIRGIEELKQKNSAANNESFRSLGLRECPGCHSWIEKGPSVELFGMPLAEGCDKMTCRCGTQFCYRCGSINATCQCTSSEHGFFSHQEVLSDYPSSLGNLFM